jgi:hypothetical protein
MHRIKLEYIKRKFMVDNLKCKWYDFNNEKPVIEKSSKLAFVSRELRMVEMRQRAIYEWTHEGL